MSDEVAVDSGWAPCIAPGCVTEEEARRIRDELIPKGANVGALIGELAFLSDGQVKIALDMWWGISVAGRLSGMNASEQPVQYATWVEADDLEIGLAETYRRWAAKYEEVRGRAWTPAFWDKDGIETVAHWDARVDELKKWVQVFLDDPPEKTYGAHQVAAMLAYQAKQLEDNR